MPCTQERTQSNHKQLLDLEKEEYEGLYLPIDVSCGDLVYHCVSSGDSELVYMEKQQQMPLLRGPCHMQELLLPALLDHATGLVLMTNLP